MQTLNLTKKYERYPGYKDSGVEWLGKIPKKWEAQKVVSVFDFPNEKVTEEDYEPLSVTYGGIKRQVEGAAKVAEGSLRKLVKVGDIAINGRSDRKGAVGVSEYEGGVSLVYNVLRKRDENTDTKYFHYLMRSNLFSEEFYRWGRGIVDDLWTTRASEMKRISITVPNSTDQTKIAIYLNEKTVLIDQIIEKKKKLIELLREKCTAVINHAVTKGLDPKPELVESGIDWIGRIPKGWEVKKLKSGFNFEKGKEAGKFTQEFVGNENNVGLFPVYSGQTENEGVLGTINTFKYDYPDGVLFSTTVGAKAMTTKLLKGKFSLSQNCVLMVPNKKADSAYFNYLLEVGFKRMRDSIPSHMQPSLRVSDLNKFTVLFPNMDVQKSIAKYLDIETEGYEKAVGHVEQSIELLQEFKSSLISHVVTGKIRI